ncbi:MAG: AAA family ATPase [Clostridia bacterium]|nr:AAA family ATPase [Clostridia bacterium]
MRLLSCTIVGFGKFVNQTFDLSSGIVVFKEDNGWGKTTLADFIKCMLYGLDGGRSRSVTANERMKYEPWNNSAFGGTLTFSLGGKTYRLERTFGKTPAYDRVKLYDNGGMPCYEFGDRVERLGEILFGVDCESYVRCSYVPQAGREAEGLPTDVKNRLMRLLSAADNGNGADRALTRLEEADRALRAKRRPAKGKLDEIDERLESLARRRAECETCGEKMRALKGEIESVQRNLSALDERIGSVFAEMESVSRRNEWEANKLAYAEVRARYDSAAETLNALSAFFGATDPTTLNVDGLQTAITEFYALEEEIGKIKEALAGLQARPYEREALAAQVETCKKTLESYELILNKEQETEEEKTEAKKTKKALPKAGKWFAPLVVLCVFAAIFGGIWIQKSPAFGGALLALGGVGLAFGFFSSLRRYPKRKKKREKDDEWDIKDKALADAYFEAKTQYAEAKEKLELCTQALADAQQGGAILAEKQTRADELEKAICAFLDHFRFEQHYDYRASLATLKEKAEAYARAKQAHGEYGKKLSEMTPPQDLSAYAQTDMETLKAKKFEAERGKEELLAYRERLFTQMESLERLEKEKDDLAGEEALWTSEKKRLENRLRAIRAAKELLLRARSNLASRYLTPVEERTREYLTKLSASARIGFNAEGRAYVDENGTVRETGYYSAGTQDALDFCVRIALADSVFTKEKPVLLLDDPFVNFDDQKTEKAKALLKELSSRYQILYFTCKSERRL